MTGFDLVEESEEIYLGGTVAPPKDDLLFIFGLVYTSSHLNPELCSSEKILGSNR